MDINTCLQADKGKCKSVNWFCKKKNFFLKLMVINKCLPTDKVKCKRVKWYF